MIRVGVIALVLVGFFLYSGYSRHIPFLPKGGEVVTAEFLDASNVRSSTNVRIHGVDVGTVEKIDTIGDGASRKAIVKMRIKDSADAEVLRSDATASIYWRTLLGRNMYIELDPGKASGELGSATIPVDRTQTQVEFDKALEPLDKTGRKAVQQFFDFLDDGFQLAAAPRATIDGLAPAMRPLGPAVTALRGQSTGDLIAAVRSTRDVTANLDKIDAKLASLIDNGNVAIGVTAARSADISSTLQIAPGALDVTRREMASLRGTLDRVDPVAEELRPGARVLDDTARSLRPALDDVRPVLRDTKPLLRDLDPAVQRLQTTARRGTPLIAQLQPTVNRLNEETIPFLDSAHQPSGRKVYQTVGPTFSALASAGANFDANGHDIAFQPGAGLRLAEGFLPCSVYLNDPSSAQKVTCDGFLKGLNSLFGGGGGSTRKATAPSLGSATAVSNTAPTTADATTAGGDSPATAEVTPATATGSALGGFWDKASLVLGKDHR
jgi:virulence factor Mce-like protein